MTRTTGNSGFRSGAFVAQIIISVATHSLTRYFPGYESTSRQIRFSGSPEAVHRVPSQYGIRSRERSPDPALADQRSLSGLGGLLQLAQQDRLQVQPEGPGRLLPVQDREREGQQGEGPQRILSPLSKDAD